MRRLVTLLCVCFAVLCAAPALAEVYTASPEGTTLTALLAKAQDGDTILLAEGTYAEPQEVFPLRIDHAVTIRAADGTHAVIDAPPFQPAFRIEASGVTIKDLDIRFRRTGLYALGNDMTVENCTISLADPAWRTSSCGVWMGGIYRAAFHECAFYDCGIAMAGPPLSESSHLVPVLTGLFEVGEDIRFFTTHEITKCTVNDKPLFYAAGQENVTVPENAGLILIADCREVLVKNADVSRSSMGMEIIYCDHVRVENSQADECGVFGIYLAKLSGGEVVDCSAKGTNHGIDVRASKNITLLRCRANACDQGLFFSKVDGGLMKDCLVTSTGQGYFYAAGNHCLVDHCQAIDCENGMNIQKENDMLITGCTLRGNTICAVRLDGSPTIFTDNLLEDNWVGVMAYGDVPFVLNNNTIRTSGSCALYLRDIAYSRISGNLIQDSAQHSVEASGEMSETLFIGNTIDRSIVYSKDATLRLEGNIIADKQ